MKHLILLAVFFTAGACMAQINLNHVQVSSYTTSGGTYVASHYRTAPNITINDNFSTVGNINPYTGEAGTVSRESYGYAMPTNYEFVNTYNMLPVIPIKAPPPLKFEPAPTIQKEQVKDTSQSISENLYASKPTDGLWTPTEDKRPSLEKWETNLDKAYVQTKDGTYQPKKPLDFTGVYVFVGLCFLGVLIFVVKSKN